MGISIAGRILEILGREKPVPSARRLDHDALVADYVKGNKTLREVAAAHGCSAERVRQVLRSRNIPSRSQKESWLLRNPRLSKLRDEAWVRREYIGRKRSIKDIAADLNCNMMTVRRAMIHHGIELRNPRQNGLLHSKRMSRCKVEPETIRRLYHEQELEVREFADTLGCNYIQIHRLMVKHGIQRRAPGKYKRTKAIYNKIDVDWLRREHLGKGRSLYSLANEMNVSPTVVYRAAKKLGIWQELS